MRAVLFEGDNKSVGQPGYWENMLNNRVSYVYPHLGEVKSRIERARVAAEKEHDGVYREFRKGAASYRQKASSEARLSFR